MKKTLLTSVLLLIAVCAFAQEDKTSYITNPSFENGFTGWTNENMQKQTNSAFSLKDGTTYVEKWVSSENSVGSASLKQTLKNVPNGSYKLTVAAQNYSESSPTKANTGAHIYAGEKQITVKTPKDYTVSFTCITGDVEIGFVATDATGNWLCVDNFRLSLVSELDAAGALAELQKNITNAEKKTSRKMSSEASNALNSAISDAKLITETSSNEDLQAAARTLQTAVTQADASYKNFTSLKTLMSKASLKLKKEMSSDAYNELNTAYDTANNIYENPESTDTQAQTAKESLEAAIDHADTAITEYANVGTLLKSAQNQQGNQMSNSASAALEEAIRQGEAISTESTDAQIQAATSALTEATANAKTSVTQYANLQKQLTLALAAYDESKTDADKLKAEIDNAQALVNSGDSAPDDLVAEVDILKKAVFIFNLTNATPGTGIAPEVTETKHYVATGATQALMRATIAGDNILEQGVCWSTEHNPTVLDNRSTKSFSLKGTIFHIQNLQSATVYYLRPYVMNKTYTVAYGDEVKIVTIPRGTCTWSWDGGAPTAEANERCRTAMEQTIEYFNEWTGIKGFHLSGHYGAQTQTADCSYGGWMRIGPSSSYQAIGTVLHETGHGVGVGTQIRWYECSETRENTTWGKWLGREANDVLHFLENYEGEEVFFTGDKTHGWGTTASGASGNASISYDWLVNGADKDKHTAIQYIGGMCILRGLFVDGLDPTSDGYWYTTHNGIPSYTYNFDDTKKYYLMCKDANCGLNNGLLYQRTTTALGWRPMLEGEPVGDEAAWYMEFDPATGYYFFKNAESGKYISHSGSVSLKEKNAPTSTERIQLMPDRTDVTLDFDGATRKTHGYWFTWDNDGFKSMGANTKGATATYGTISSVEFNYTNSATKQQWIILSEDELAAYQQKAIATGMIEIDDQPVPTNKSVVGIYTSGGIQLQTTQKGFNVIKYSDGTSSTIYIK